MDETIKELKEWKKDMEDIIEVGRYGYTDAELKMARLNIVRINEILEVASCNS